MFYLRSGKGGWEAGRVFLPALSGADGTAGGCCGTAKRTFSSLFMLCSEEENSGQTDNQTDVQPHEPLPRCMSKLQAICRSSSFFKHN